MLYADGNEAKLGDTVAIDRQHRGVVVANIDGAEFNEHFASGWGYLKTGILVETDFAGLVHYPDGNNEDIVLVARAK